MFDRMIESMRKEDISLPKAPEVVPVERIVEEPPHVRLKHDDEGEWVEIKMKKTPAKKATKKTSRKRAKKAAKKSSKK